MAGRYRFFAPRSRSRWAEWGPFLLALIVGAGLLLAVALTSPIFSGPAPLPDSDPQPSSASSGPSASLAPAEGPEETP